MMSDASMGNNPSPPGTQNHIDVTNDGRDFDEWRRPNCNALSNFLYRDLEHMIHNVYGLAVHFIF